MSTFEQMNFELEKPEDKSKELDPKIMEQLKSPYNEELFSYFEQGLNSAIDQIKS